MKCGLPFGGGPGICYNESSADLIIHHLKEWSMCKSQQSGPSPARIFCVILLALGLAMASGTALADGCVDYRRHMRLVGPYSGGETVTLIAGVGDWGVYADGEGSLHSINLAGPTPGPRFDSLDLGGEILDLEAAQDHFLLATVDGVGLVVVSLGDGVLAVEGSLAFPATADHLAVDGSLAVVHLQPRTVVLIDWSDPSAPVERGRALLDGSWISAVGLRGDDVFVAGPDLGYLPALWRLDFGDPANPVVAGQWVVMPDPGDGESQIEDILPTEDRIYLSYQRIIRYSPMALELRMVLITTPPDGSFTPGICPAVEVGPGEAANLQKQGDEVYQFGNRLAVFGVDDPANPVSQGRVPLPGSVGSGVVGWGLAFAACGDEGLWGLGMGDHTRVQAEVVYEDALSLNGLARMGNAVFGVGAAVDYPYSGYLELFALDATDPSAPVTLGRYVDPRTFPPVYQHLQVHDGVLYAEGAESLGVFDVSDPTVPQLVAEYPALGGYDPVLFLGEHLFKISILNRLDVHDAADPLQIFLLAQGVLENVVSMAGRDNLLVVCRNESGPRLEIYDVADPIAPVLLGSLTLDGYYDQLRVLGDQLFAQPLGGPISVYDLGDPSAPVFLSDIPAVGPLRDLHKEGDFLYLTLRSVGLQVVDMQHPTAPVILGGVTADGGWPSLVWVQGQPLFSENTALMAAAPACRPSAVGDGPAVPPVGLLVQAHPNPFNPQVNLRVSLPAAGLARVGIVDVRGRRVRQLVSEVLPAGTLDLQWNGRNDQGRNLPSGTYFVQVRGNGFSSAGKITLLR